MIKKLTLLSTLVFILTVNISSAQVTPVSLMDEISYVYVEKLVAIAKENHPRIKAHSSLINIARLKISNAKLGWLNPLSLSYVYSPATTLNLTNPTFFSGYQIGFSVNLGSFPQTPGIIKQSKEDLKLAELERDEYLLSITTEVKTRYFTYLRNLKTLKLTMQGLSNAQNSLTMIKYKFEKGEVTFEEYNNAVSGYTNSNQGKIDAEVALLTAKASLEELLGIRLEEVPN